MVRYHSQCVNVHPGVPIVTKSMYMTLWRSLMQGFYDLLFLFEYDSIETIVVISVTLLSFAGPMSKTFFGNSKKKNSFFSFLTFCMIRQFR